MRARRAAVVAAVVAAILAAGGALLMVLRPPGIDVELRDPNPAVRAAAVRRLDVRADADRLLSSLKDDNADVRLLSAMRLGERPDGPSATAAERLAPGLVDALKDRHAGVRRAAAESLAELWPVTEKALTAALTDPDPRARAGAAFALSCAPNGRDGQEVTVAQAERLRPLLRDLLNDGDSEVRQNASRALERIR